MPTRTRISPLRRGLSALMALLYLVVALGAARHAGEHDESGLEWLPSEYHHHHYEVTEDGADDHGAFHEVCVACQWSRLGQRYHDEAPRFSEAAPVLRIGTLDLAVSVRDRTTYLPDSRGPPSA
ncbi:MAG: hypothetical protein R3326_01085 [Gemmatimonadota bacterium]|nr:hypothetical protein [Gemmatimonadota bacterium]